MSVKRMLGRVGLVSILILAVMQLTFAQGRVITGKVSNAKDSLPVANASVMVKGSSRGVNTDVNGNFSISVNSENSVLVISSVGFARQEVTVGSSRNVIDISLTEAQGNLNEVVVVGYGTTRKRDLTGAVVHHFK